MSTEPNAPAPGGGLAWLGRFACRHPVPILTVAALFVGVAALLGTSAPAHLSAGGFTDPGTESARAGGVLAQTFHAEDPSFVILATAVHGTVDSAGAVAAGRALSAAVAHARGVAFIQSYWATPPSGASNMRSRDGREALILGYATGDAPTQAATAQRVATGLQASSALRVAVGGAAIVSLEASDQVKGDLVKAESIALLLTLLLMVLAFRGLVAAILPLVIGGVAIVGTLLVLRALASLISVSVYSLNLATALGLGLGIDYSLLLVSRFREELNAGLATPDAVVRTVRTAGRTVLFSAVTVAVSLLALLVFPEYFLSSFGYAGITVVALAASAALVVVPALLAVLGPRVNRFPISLTRRSKGPDAGWWHRLAAVVMRHPARIAVAVALLLAAFIVPFSDVRLGLADDRVLPASAAGRQVGDALRAHFPAFDPAPIDVVAVGPRLRLDSIARYARDLSALAGSAVVEARTGTYVGGHLRAAPAEPSRQFLVASGTWFKVLPADDPNSPAAAALVRQIRSTPGPFPIMVTGLTAQQIDTVGSVSGHLPAALAVMALVTFLALFLMTGSVIIPAKALVLSAASLSATFGVAVWVFEQGHLSSALGFTAAGYLDVSTLLLMFCLAFGLSMDYQVFLLSRIREEYDLSGDTTAAVAMGLERTGWIVTTAAALLAIVFVALATSSVSLLKLMGAGIAVALVLDATLIRALLLPALMRLLGTFNWWAPPWLRRRSGGRSPLATAASSPRKADAPRSQPAPATTAVADDDRSADSGGSASVAARAETQPPTSLGETSTAPAPATSATAGMSAATTGTPDAIASSTGSPNPSTNDGNAKTEAAR